MNNPGLASASKALLFVLLALVLLFSWGLGCACDSSGDSGGDDDDAGPPDDDDSSLLDDDTGDDDAQDDDIVPECQPGDSRCDDKALNLLLCSDEGLWTIDLACMEDQGKLCENGACVDPWRYGDPQFDPCDADPDGTAMGLAGKAAKYDELAERLHVHPLHKRINNASLPDGFTEENGTYQDVTNWHTGENDGLWTGLYIASQAFRYAVTREERALENLRLFMEGLEIGTDITGVPGLFTREYITPDIPGMSCPSDPLEYVPDVEKDDNQWVRVDEDGAILTYDPVGEEWVRSDHMVPDRFAGYCWLDNVSKDEYSGHMLALSAVHRLVDDPEVRGKALRVLDQVGTHLMENDMAATDWDGRVTEHGRFWPLALDDYPSFNAVLGLSYIKSAAMATGRQDLKDFYDDCLLQKSGPNDCLDRYLTPPQSYADWLWFTGLYLGRDACKANWNNFSMMFLGMFTLIWHEWEPELRGQLQEVLEERMFYHNDNHREMARQHNAGWTFAYASMKDTGPGSTGQDVEAINDAICTLRRFPESKASPELHVGEDEFPTDWSCESRFSGSYLTFDPVPVNLRCPSTFIWWGNPYRHQNCTENPQYVKQPGDYLLTYWMGRYFGYIDESW